MQVTVPTNEAWIYSMTALLLCGRWRPPRVPRSCLKRPEFRALALWALAAVRLGAEPTCKDGSSAFYLPKPMTSAHVRPIDSMHVVRTATIHPFWMALPTEQATPGYLSNSARDTRIMNPSGSVLVHQILG